MNLIQCSHRELSSRVQLPSSKSIANRLLIIRALSGDRIKISNLIESDDTLLMQSCLQEFKNSSSIDAQNAGTVFRFLTAFLSIQEGEWCLTGAPRMLLRPVGPLVDALRDLGAEISYLGAEGYPPLKIRGRSLAGGKVVVDATSSSQYLSALLMIAPMLNDELEITITGHKSSEPYIDMTVGLMKILGAEVEKQEQCIRVSPGMYKIYEMNVEADWSASAFFFAAAALSEKCKLVLPGLWENSLQGDAVLPAIFSKLGVHAVFDNGEWIMQKVEQPVKTFTYDFTDHPDLFVPVAIACAGLGIGFHGCGLKNLRIKESDRLQGVLDGLCALGWDAGILPSDDFIIAEGIPGSFLKDVCISTRGDHRLAMAFAVLSMVTGSIMLDDLGVASKSFPGFVEELEHLGFSIS